MQIQQTLAKRIQPGSSFLNLILIWKMQLLSNLLVYPNILDPANLALSYGCVHLHLQLQTTTKVP
jgi:hypothetical protein